MRSFAVNFPSLQRLSLLIGSQSSYGGYAIVTPSLKYFKVVDFRDMISYLIEPMPKLEEADISVTSGFEKLLESVISVKRLSLNPIFDSAKESVYPVGIVFNQLQHLKLRIYKSDWSKLLIWLLRNSPKLRVFNLCVDWSLESDEYEPVKWNNSSPIKLSN